MLLNPEHQTLNSKPRKYFFQLNCTSEVLKCGDSSDVRDKRLKVDVGHITAYSQP
jgi:hypothetical protein